MSKKRNNTTSAQAEETKDTAADVIEQGIENETKAPEEAVETAEDTKEEVSDDAKSDDAEPSIADVAKDVNKVITKGLNEAAEVAKDIAVTLNTEISNKKNTTHTASASKPDHVNNSTGSTTTKPVSKKNNFKAGGILDLVKEPLYSSPYGTRPLKKITGRYYVYDGVNRNGYYRITDRKANVKRDLKYIIGYIKK